MSDSSLRETALITGASAGIGAVYADRLARRGYDLTLVARNEARLKEVANRISGDTGRSVRIMQADLSNKQSTADVEQVLREDPAITMLVNNAGVGAVASILDGNVDAMDHMIAVNITALTRLTYAVAPALVKRGKGTIINLASVVGIAVEMLNGVYSASKSYVISLGHTLQRDLAGTNVRVQTVLPGATATEFWSVAGHPGMKTANHTMAVENMVDAALAGLDAGELVTMPSLHENELWSRWEADRRTLSKKFANSVPAARYTY